MPKHYPRKQTVILFIFCTIFVAVLAFYSLDKNDEKLAINNEPVILNTVPESTPIVTDTDWKKSFFTQGTSTTNFKTAKLANKSNKVEIPLTATDKFGQNFFTKYAELNQLGLTKNPQAVNSATNQIISDSIASIVMPVPYTLKDLIIAPNEINNIQLYARTIIDILKIGIPETNEVDVTMNAFEKNDFSLLTNIDPIIVNYQSTITKLLSTPVPQPIAEDHLKLTNAINLRLFNAKSLRKADSDPITALTALGLETGNLQEISLTITHMQNYFTNAGISFLPSVSE